MLLHLLNWKSRGPWLADGGRRLVWSDSQRPVDRRSRHARILRTWRPVIHDLPMDGAAYGTQLRIITITVAWLEAHMCSRRTRTVGRAVPMGDQSTDDTYPCHAK